MNLIKQRESLTEIECFVNNEISSCKASEFKIYDSRVTLDAYCSPTQPIEAIQFNSILFNSDFGILEDLFMGQRMFFKLCIIVLGAYLVFFILKNISMVIYTYLISVISTFCLLTLGLQLIQLSLGKYLLRIFNPLNLNINYFQIRFLSLV